MPEDSPDREIIQTILDRIDALDQKVQELLLFARPRAPSLASVSLRGLVRDIVEQLELDPRLSAVEVSISSDDPTVLAWPWEALYDPQTGMLGQTAQVLRRLNRLRIESSEKATLPRDRIHILLVTARPYQQDVSYRSISRPLVDLIQQEKLPAQVTLLRPPTIAALRQHLTTHSWIESR